MESCTEFLETTTIHGIPRIGSAKKILKLFWLLIVFIGFSSAFYLIYNALKSYQESPIMTTLETFPIAEAKFPKVTVCPPKGTLTNMNYDLTKVGGKSMSGDDKEEFVKVVTDLIIDQEIQDIVEQDSSYKMENKYKSWFHGFTQFELPQFKQKESFIIFSTENSSAIETPYYGQNYSSSTFPFKLNYILAVHPPSNVTDPENYRSVLEIEMDTKEDKIDGGGEEIIDLTPTDLRLNVESFQLTGKKTIKRKFPLPQRKSKRTYIYTLNFKRDLGNKDLEGWNKKRVTGMKATWYTIDKEGNRVYLPSDSVLANSKNQELVKFVKIGQHLRNKGLENVEEILKTSVKVFRKDLFIKDGRSVQNRCNNGMFWDWEFSPVLDSLTSEHNISDEDLKKVTTSEEIIEAVGKVFVTLVSCPKEKWTAWFEFYRDLFSKYKLSIVILNLVRISKMSRMNNLLQEAAIADALLDQLLLKYDLQYRNIEKISSGLALTSKGFSDDSIFSISNHPVHILEQEKMNPSAFIPFCRVGDNNSSDLRVQFDKLGQPICDAFKPSALYDQICYSFDFGALSSKEQKAIMRHGIEFLMDYNEDRSYFNSRTEANSAATIHLETIAPLLMTGEGVYSLSAVKEVSATDAFLSYDESVRGCQNIESLQNCQTKALIDEIDQDCNCMPFHLSKNEDFCDETGLKCFSKILSNPTNKQCLKSCTGMYSDIIKHTQDVYEKELEKWKPEIKIYQDYKNMFQQDIHYPPEFKGLKFMSKLRLVKIFFSTPTFDMITMDERANFETKLSVIGGTMGLFTGFSLISGVEIIYFIVKGIIGNFHRKNNKGK